MSEENLDENEDAEEIEENEIDSEDSSNVTEAEIDEDDVLTEDELDEIDEAEESEEEKKEVGATLVFGQGDFSVSNSNRGADDPSDNTLCEPQYISKYGDMVFITDKGNHRVMVWNSMPEENGDFANVVLGQEDFSDCLENRGITTTLDEMTSGLGDENLDGFTISKPEDDTLSQPAGVAVIAGKLYVADSGNQRVVRWTGLPTEDGEAPDFVLGQDNLECGEANRRGIIGSGSLFFPMAIRSGDDQHVFVADKDNHRVLIWKKIPFSNGWNADVVLGQADMDEREPNRGEFTNVTPDSMSFPTGVFFDPESEKVIVVDQGNNRVLVWNKMPSENGTPADLVLGQKDFYSREVNRGFGEKRAGADGMYFPTDVVFGKKGLFITDTGNHRVLCWSEFPTENGQPADSVIGQKDFIGNQVNRGEDEPSEVTLNDPYGLFLEQDPEDEEDIGRLYIADRSNSRVVVWDEIPAPPGEDEDEDDLPVDYIEDPNMLIGDDEEFYAGFEGNDSSEEEESEDPALT
ncbi:MAG: NHL repeat-containing protein [Nitrospinales bacterium]